MENRNKSKLWLNIAMIAFIGFIVSACDDGTKPTGGNPAHTHEWSEYIQTINPTCTTAGVKTRTCKSCSVLDTVTETGDDAFGHEWEYSEGSILPTCEEDGHGSRECTRDECEEKENDINFNALGHKWGEWDVTKFPTCIFAGVKIRECEACEKEETDEVGIDENEHDIEVVDGVAPTCLLDGHGTIRCKRDACEFTKTGDILEKRNHHFIDHWEEVDVVTCTTAGLDERFCTRDCGEEGNRDTRIIEALGHHFVDHWGEVEAATCTTVGLEERFCTRDCGEEGNRDTRVINVLGHDWENWVTTATFLTEGEKTRICKNNSSHIETVDEGPLPITSTADWVTAINQLNGKTGSYTLTVNGDIGVEGSTAISFGETTNDSLNVTLKGSGKLYLTSRGNLLRIDTNQKLIIDSEHLILQGLTNGQNGATQDNNVSLLYIKDGVVEFNSGVITGNNNTSSTGSIDETGGVNIYDNGWFIMNGGLITGNSGVSHGGVSLNGTFIMNGGEISGNSFYGVSVKSGGSFSLNNGKINNCARGVSVGGVFTMNGGEISYNRSGGVLVSRAFNMNGGIIYANTATAGGGVIVSGQNAIFTMRGGEIAGNKATTSNSGGGVYVYDRGTFRIVSGTIYGSNEANVSLRNTANNGIGDVLYKSDTSASMVSVAQRGTFNGETWNGTNIALTYQNSLASYTNNTLRVVNGVLQ